MSFDHREMRPVAAAKASNLEDRRGVGSATVFAVENPAQRRSSPGVVV